MTRNTPPKKATMPRNRSFLVKNRNVRLIPIVIVSPTRNRMSPIANNAESKKKTIPRKRNTHPCFDGFGEVWKDDLSEISRFHQCQSHTSHACTHVLMYSWLMVTKLWSYQKQNLQISRNQIIMYVRIYKTNQLQPTTYWRHKWNIYVSRTQTNHTNLR